MLAPWKESYDQHRQHIKKQRHYFANKGPSSQSYGFSSRHVWMWELDYKESWALKNWCFWTMVLEKTLESPVDCKEIKPVHPKGNQSWIFIGRTDDKVETPILWPPSVKNWLIGKGPDAGKDCRQEKRAIEDEMVGWHHWLDEHEFEQAPGVGDGQRSLVCCSPRSHKELTYLSDWIELNSNHFILKMIWLTVTQLKMNSSINHKAFAWSKKIFCYTILNMPEAMLLNITSFKKWTTVKASQQTY